MNRLAAASAALVLALAPGPPAAAGSPRPPGPPRVPAPSAERPTAYFVLHAADVRDRDRLEELAGVGVVVCAPELGHEALAHARRALPGALFLAYVNVQDVPIDVYPGPSYYRALSRTFDPALCLRDLDSGEPVSFQRSARGDPVPAFVLGARSVETLVRFVRNTTMRTAWDGIYLDQCTREWPAARRRALAGRRLDADGDGRADDPGTVLRQYRRWRPELTRRLRAALGEGVLIVANSAGALDDPALNGLTLEGPGVRTAPGDVRRIVESQRRVGRAPALFVLWETSPATRAPIRGLVRELPGVHWGRLGR